MADTIPPSEDGPNIIGDTVRRRVRKSDSNDVDVNCEQGAHGACLTQRCGCACHQPGGSQYREPASPTFEAIMAVRRLDAPPATKQAIIRALDMTGQSAIEADGARSQNEQMTDALLAADDEVAALRADLEQTTDERNALLHARTTLRAELAGWQTTAQQYEEIVRTTEAELERITTERDAAMKVVTDLDDWLNDCAYGRDDVVAGEDSHARLWDIREAYRVATSGQERCECVPAVDEDGAPDGYEYVCNLHEKASEREASDA